MTHTSWVVRQASVSQETDSQTVRQVMSLCKAFNITVSVKEDISEEAVRKLKSWTERKALYAYAVLENETAKRHFHASVFCDDVQNARNIHDTLWKLIKPFHPTSIGRFAVHVQACPGRKWIDEYLQKESSREILVNRLPTNLDDLDDYFPDEEVQHILQEKASKKQDSVCDPWYATQEVHYKEWLRENDKVSSQIDALEYFKYRMFVKKDMRVVEDRRRLMQKALCLHEYSMEIQAPTAEERRQYLHTNTEYDFNPPR